MSEQDRQATTIQRPHTNDLEEWKAYWTQEGYPWRTEPEINAERQRYLTDRRSITPDTEKGIYPFKGIELSRADVEWLLASHDNGRGPVDWNKESQPDPYFARKGLDFRGVDLRSKDLHSLPLARLIGFTTERSFASNELHEAAIIHLEGADLSDVHLEGATLPYAHLERANLSRAHLERANLSDVHLEGARLEEADMEEAKLWNAHMEGTSLSRANLRRAQLSSARLDGAHLKGANLKSANLYEAHLEEADLTHAHLENAYLVSSFLDSATKLDEIFLGNKKDGFIYLLDIHWGDANLAVVDWSAISVLGHEPTTEKRKRFHRRPKVVISRVKNYPKAIRAYRQVAVVLRNQGLDEDAARFTYRAQIMQRKVFWHQRKVRQNLGSLSLDLLTGYGYKPWRSFLAYLIVITAFATAYFIIGRTVGPTLSPLGAWVFSMTSFHGRGFFPGGIRLDDPLTVLAALEGLLIEVTFIATFTQRFFGK